MTKVQGRRPTITRFYLLLLAAAVVGSPGWSLPSGEDASDSTTMGSRMVAPGFETGVMRATPTAATARDVDRSMDRRPFPPLAALVLLAGCLGALALTVTTMTVEGRKALGGEPWSSLGSRAPPRPALA